MLNDEFLIVLGSFASLVVLFFVLILFKTFKRRQNAEKSSNRSERFGDKAIAERQDEISLSASFSSTTSPHVPASPAPRRPINYERFPQLSASIQQAKARRELVTTLAYPLTTLLNVSLARAIDLYCEDYSVSGPEGARAVADAMHDGTGEKSPTQCSFPNGADPLITLLLLHANCRDDAIDYFCLSSGASLAEAREAIDTLQPLARSASWFFFEEGMPNEPPLDPASLQFLIRAGYKSLAIRYYRRRTAVSLTEAKKAVEKLSQALTNSVESHGIAR